MSSQSGGIPVHHIPDEAGYRLIELPPELVSLLESDTSPVLTLEHSDSSALLKTPGKTYALRQKNTSNALMLVASRSDPDAPSQAIAILCTIRETVELEPVVDKTAGGGGGGAVKNTGSKGKWHERFGRNR